MRASIRDGLPNICGSQDEIERASASNSPVFHRTAAQLEGVRSAFALALHMHQPTIPASGDDVRTSALICNLDYMYAHRREGDNHNASSFEYCYHRMADFIRQLHQEGKSPRIMLDYSGNLLWGLEQMGKTYILDKLKVITRDPTYNRYVEWLGTMWSHAVVPSTPVPDIKLQIRAWQHHFAAIFGVDALKRVKGFSPPEMHLPNHPEVTFEYISALRQCGYRWVLVQEHTVEKLDGTALTSKHLPHRLVARNAKGDTIAITALIKTQGSDTKLVAQMQPLAEARDRSRQKIGDRLVPCLVSQIADGENGGVMMNEFPRDYLDKMRQLPRDVPAFNGTEYLELIEASGVSPDDYEPIQPLHQSRLWKKFSSGTPAQLEEAIDRCKKEDPRFSMEGGSWTGDISWTRGYDNVLDPMKKLSARFHEVIDGKDIDADEYRYRNALTHLLLSQTSCFRYWGQGRWTDYAREICRRGMDILQYDF